jgi:hypothetical protein
MSDIKTYRQPRGFENNAVDGQTVDPFKFRVGIQQFMNDHASLFRTIASLYDNPNIATDDGSLAGATKVVNTLMREMAKAVYGRDQLTPEELRPFRSHCSDIVASAWKDGKLEQLNIQQVVSLHSRALLNIDQDLDKSLWDNTISESDAIMMTVSALSCEMLKAVMLYDFRQDKASLASDLSQIILFHAKELTNIAVLPNAKPEARRSMFQTSVRRLGDLMVDIYARKVRQVLAHTASMSPSDQDHFFDTYNPVGEILETFKEHSSNYSGLALANTKMALGLLNVEENQVPNQKNRDIPW